MSRRKKSIPKKIDLRIAFVHQLLKETLTEDVEVGNGAHTDTVEALIGAVDYHKMSLERLEDVFALLMSVDPVHEDGGGEPVRAAIYAAAERVHDKRCACCRIRRAV